MAEVKVVKQIPASLDACWALFSNFGDMSWLPGDQVVEPIGEGVGMARRMHIKGIDPFDEILTAMDHDAKTFSYSIPKNSVIPFDDYVANISLSGDDSACEVSWVSTFDEGDLDKEQSEEMIAGNYSMMLDAAAEKLSK